MKSNTHENYKLKNAMETHKFWYKKYEPQSKTDCFAIEQMSKKNTRMEEQRENCPHPETFPKGPYSATIDQ